ncbi:MAG: hypothetical protein AB7W16_01300 [Candidatus Obscuribacterales bacterium]
MRLSLVLVAIFTILGFAVGSILSKDQVHTVFPSLGCAYTDISKIIKTTGDGQILSVEYHEPPDKIPWNPRIKLSEMISAMRNYAPGRKSSEIRKMLGRPRTLERSVPLKSWPGQAKQSEEVWLYLVGPHGWGEAVALCFSNDTCRAVVILDSSQASEYEHWKADTGTAFAPGKTAAEILNKLGEPNRRTRRESNQGGEIWDYDAFHNTGLTVEIENGKCIRADETMIMH